MCRGEIWWRITLQTLINRSEWANTSQNKMSNNFETGGDTRNMSIDHDNETGVALPDSVSKTCVKRP